MGRTRRSQERGARAGRASKGGGGLGTSSQTLTADDFVPVPNVSEYIEEKKLELLTFLLPESRFVVLYDCVVQL